MSRRSLFNPFAASDCSHSKILLDLLASKVAYESLFDLHNWYEPLSNATISTVFQDISREEARAMIAVYSDEVLKDYKSAPSSEQHAILEALEAKIGRSFGTLGSRDFFIRLSTRSGRDACLSCLHPWFPDAYKRELSRTLKNAAGKKLAPTQVQNGDDAKCGGAEAVADDNLQAISVIRAAASLMRMETPREALWLLTHSKRIYADLMRALHCSDSGICDWDVKIALREWVNIDACLEVRGVVYGGHLSVLGQYSNLICVPWVDPRALVELCVDFFHTQVRGKLPGTVMDCVIDFGISKNLKKVWVIELNPFGPGTDIGLFSWARHRRILQGGSDGWGDIENWERAHTPDDVDDSPKEILNLKYQGVHCRFLSVPLPGAAKKLLRSARMSKIKKSKKKCDGDAAAEEVEEISENFEIEVDNGDVFGGGSIATVPREPVPSRRKNKSKPGGEPPAEEVGGTPQCSIS